MSERSTLGEFLRDVLLGAGVFAAGGAAYGVVEALTNTAQGLYLPLSGWVLAVAVYAVLGLLAGLGAGVVAFVWRRIAVLPRAEVGPLLGALFLGGLVFVYVGIPLNTRALPDLVSVRGLIGNGIFAAVCAVLTVVFYLFLDSRRAPGWFGTFVALTLWVSALLAVGDHVDTFVHPISLSASGLLPFLGIVAVCAVLYVVTLWAVRALASGSTGRAAPIAVLAVIVLVVAGLVLRLHAGGEGTSAPPPAGKPNVVWLVMDTTRADHLSVYGYPKPTSPTLEQVAKDGAVFDRAHSESSWTIPGHFVMVTGRYDAAREKLLGEEFTTAAELFRDQGYETGAVLANMALGRGSGFEQGFDVAVDGPVRIFYQQAFERIPVIRALIALGIAPPDAVLRRFHQKTFLQNEAVRAENVNQWAVDWIDDRDPDRPFFLFINYMDPHDSYDPPAEFREKFAAGADPVLGFQRYSRKLGGTISSNSFVRDISSQFDEKTWSEMVGLYDGEVAYLDAQIGKLLEALKERGLADDTIVVITADHGELLGEHGLANHFKALTEEETHIPLLMRYPGKIPAGTRIATPSQLRDILPTILELAAISPAPPMDGRSLVALLEGREEDVGDGESYGFLHRPADKKFDFTQSGHLLGIRTDEAQYVWSSTGKHEFYDLKADPQARQNLHGSGQPDEAQMAQRLEQWRSETGFSDFGGKQKVDRLMKDKLKALGYAN
ncbi:MAG: hypothetical protein FJ144_15895 [Deltaproteobacteria bacterium]|nr:hypothetical protein [Deltaproteobacteria bacterium]